MGRHLWYRVPTQFSTTETIWNMQSVNIAGIFTFYFLCKFCTVSCRSVLFLDNKKLTFQHIHVRVLKFWILSIVHFELNSRYVRLLIIHLYNVDCIFKGLYFWGIMNFEHFSLTFHSVSCPCNMDYLLWHMN